VIHKAYTETYVEFSFSGRTYQYTTEAGGLTDLEVHLNYNISQYILVQGLVDSDSGDVNLQMTCDPVPLEKVPYYDQFIPFSFQITNFDISIVPNELVVSISSEKDYKIETGWIVNLQSQPLTQVMYTV